jgi:hypothetical protein
MFTPPNENQDGNNAAIYQFEQNRNQGDNQGSMAWRSGTGTRATTRFQQRSCLQVATR